MNHLIVFAKYPEAGRVKTRIANEIGDNKAANFYKEMVEKIVHNVQPQKNEYIPILNFDPPERQKAFHEWLPGIEKQFPQCPGNLGERLSFATQLSFDQGANKVVIIGSDCIEVNHFLIMRAFSLLDKEDVVLGPATDGGYYLIGLRLYQRELFADITWSTKEVLNQTLEKAKELRLKVSLLPELTDIDSFEDYQKYLEKSNSSPL